MFPPALLGRIVTIPYFPLSAMCWAASCGCSSGAFAAHRDSHDAKFGYDQWVHRSHRDDVRRSGFGRRRIIDNIITNTMLPALSREFLTRSLAREELTEARVTIRDGQFAYEWIGETKDAFPPPAPAQAEASAPPETVPTI